MYVICISILIRPTCLSFRDLSFNLLVTWDVVTMVTHLPSVATLDVTSNPLSLPISQLASITHLNILNGIASFVDPFRRICSRCSLYRNHNSPMKADPSTFRYTTHCSLYSLAPRVNLSSFWKLNFFVSCQEFSISAEFCSQIRAKYSPSSYYSVRISHLCWQEIKKWTLCNIPIGVVAMGINLVVVVTVVCCATLRNNVTMLLISNMALGDFLLGLYLFSLTVSRHIMPASKFFELIVSHNYSFCNSLLVIFIIAQCLSVLVGFLVVLERYLCIVFSMNPDIRITKTIAKRLLIGTWLFTIIACSIPSMADMYLTIDAYSCINIRSPIDDSVFITHLATAGGVVYLLSYILYAHIFYTVKNSSQNMGIQRDGKVAKRIMLVISSNLFFFLVPTTTMHFFVGVSTVHNRVHLFALWHTVGQACLGINSIFNPLLYAFRNDKFRSVLKKKFKCRENRVGVMNAN